MAALAQSNPTHPSSERSALPSRQGCLTLLDEQIAALRLDLKNAGISEKKQTPIILAMKNAFLKAYISIGERADNLSGTVGEPTLKKWVTVPESPEKKILALDKKIQDNPHSGAIAQARHAAMRSEVKALWEPVIQEIKDRLSGAKKPQASALNTVSLNTVSLPSNEAAKPRAEPTSVELANPAQGLSAPRRLSVLKDPVLTKGDSLDPANFPKALIAAIEETDSAAAKTLMDSMALEVSAGIDNVNLSVIDGLTYMVIKGHHPSLVFNFIEETASAFCAPSPNLLTKRTDFLFNLIRDGHVKVSDETYRAAYNAHQALELAGGSVEKYGLTAKDLISKHSQTLDPAERANLSTRIELRLLYIAQKLSGPNAGSIGLAELLKSARNGEVAISEQSDQAIYAAGEHAKIAIIGMADYIKSVRFGIDAIHRANPSSRTLEAQIKKTSRELDFLMGSLEVESIAALGLEHTQLLSALEATVRTPAYHKGMLNIEQFEAAIRTLKGS